ncbi:hypothetical protein [Burkholderia phage FLC8]|nr:hypothetical protein [Burkholderia phage FLC8]
MNNAINLQVAILNALLNPAQEISCTLAAIKHKVARQAVVATEEEILETLTGLMNQGKIELTKNVSDNDAWMLLQPTRNELLENKMNKQELAVPQEPVSENNGRVLKTMTVGQLPEGQAAVWLSDLAKAQGEDVIRMRDAFGIALVMTDYVKFVALSGGFMDRQDIPSILKKMVFVDEAGEFIQPGKTITVHEKNFQAHLWVKVLSPGVNQVITHVEHRDDDRFSLSYNKEDGGAGSFWEKVKGDWKKMADFFGLPWDAEKESFKIPLAPTQAEVIAK